MLIKCLEVMRACEDYAFWKISDLEALGSRRFRGVGNGVLKSEFFNSENSSVGIGVTCVRDSRSNTIIESDDSRLTK